MRDETAEAMAMYNLPDLPEQDMELDPETDDYASAPRDLILFRRNKVSILLVEYVSLDDAKEYCSQDDTHGDGWFIGFDRT
jgi:hypothetical protein